MDIEIRPLRESEIPQAARVVDLSFRTNGASIVRTPEVWRWRYWEMPGFDPRGAIAAVAGGRVVGTVMVTHRRLLLGGRRVRFGVVDDVATLPECRGAGVARRMMGEALRFMEASGAEGTCLYADPKGVARDLYLDLGYRDLHPFHLWIRLLAPGILADVAPGLFRLPEVSAGAPLPPGRTGARWIEAAEGAAYRAALARASGGMAGTPELDGGNWAWMRERNPTRPLLLGLGEPLRAGCTLCPVRVSLLSAVEVPGAWLGEMFFGEGSDPLPAALAVARRMRCAFLGAPASARDGPRISRLRRSGFLPTLGATLMVKSFGELDLGALRSGPAYPMLESLMGVP